MAVLSVNNIEQFKETLRTVPAIEAKKHLQTRIEDCAHQLLSAFKSGNDESQIQTAANFGLLEMAKERANGEPPHHPNAVPTWVNEARGDLAEFIAQDPGARAALYKSVYFSRDNKAKRTFAKNISSWIEPCADYDDRSFLAGVALGEIVIGGRYSTDAY
jgi:hypothetical protein